MRTLSRIAAALALTGALLFAGAPVAAQATDEGVSRVTSAQGPTAPGTAVRVPEGDVSAAGWYDCPSGSLCVWSGPEATGSRCTWSGADADWYSGSIQCSWADNQPVRSLFNRGTSSSYWGVVVYAGANYGGVYGCLQQGYAMYDISYSFRSHRWRTSCG
ncbi:peptidase inhibitor family I36 protein [Micromonospora cathayae]|uniref:Peptidase inhibitor family I36 protein n=1 Tax=Micromonospora cathayae TaxID=3028804 RepID=A0ABY7ZS34_9ACTN|nr:peptidase inhibitor family I36 protein [Micromonospora sp. HUAS 3]WDZ85196.1 peptidase inhibitor family I36 protein [Micromonospora sp. HUAS 3]